MADITIVIPSFKAARTIERAVLSVLAQPQVAARVVVVVDGADEEAEARVLALDDPRVSVLVNAVNRGAQVSRNRGLAEVATDHVLFLDSDDYVTGDLLAPLLDEMATRNADIGFGPFIRLNEDTNSCVRRAYGYTSPAALFRAWLTRWHFTPPCSVVWRTPFLRAIGGWDESVARNQDGELVLRAILLGASICATRQGAGVYTQHVSEHRVSSSVANLPALVHVANKLAGIESDVVPLAERRLYLGENLYPTAAKQLRLGNRGIGRELLRNARELGYRKHRGTVLVRTGSSLLGVERYQRLAQRLRTIIP